MHNYDQSIEPTATPGGEFTDGNPVAGLARTILRSFWPNMVQRELLAILAAAGVAPDQANFGQVIQSIQALINSAQLSAVTTANSYTDHLPYGMRVGEIKQVPVDPGAGATFTKGGFVFAELKGQDFAEADYPAARAFIAAWYGVAVWAQRANFPGLFSFGPEAIFPTRFALPDMRGLFVRSTGGNAAALGVLQTDEIKSHDHAIYVAASSDSADEGAGPTNANFNSGNSTRRSGDTGGAETRPTNTAWPWIIRLT